MAFSVQNTDASGYTRQLSTPTIDSEFPSSYRGGTDAYGIVTYAAELLTSGLTGLTEMNPGTNTSVWDAGGFARITYNVSGTYGLRFTPDTTKTQVYVRFELRRNQLNTTKQFKLLGNGAILSNATMGAAGGGYTGNLYYIGYGDNVASENDGTCITRMDGTLQGGSAYTRTPPTDVYSPAMVYQDYSGTVWEQYELFWKYNDSGVANGEIIIWKDSVLIFHFTNVYNCADGVGNNTLGQIGIGEYSGNAGVYEDYRNLSISYERPTGRGV